MSSNRSLNTTIHAPARLRICGMLRHVDAIDFAAIRESLGITDSSLSKHLAVLTDAGYVTMKKESSVLRVDARRIVWVKLTESGRCAFDDYIETLQTIIADDRLV